MFKKHGPCPKCPSRDALAIYSHNEHCFSCGYHKNYNKRELPSAAVEALSIIREPISPHIPLKFQEYLKSFQITEKSISSYFGYSGETDRLCMVIGGFLEGRSLTKTPKVVTHGSKPCHIFPEWPKAFSIIVLVEDGISALKVSYVNSCGALFGSR